MSNILVTGGAGYIGSHTCKALAATGLTPVTFDNLSRGHSDFVRWGPLVVGDILDAAALDKAMKQFRPSSVIHFAAFAYVGESVADPISYYRNNSCGIVNVLDAMLKNAIEQIVFSSSCTTYGLPDTLPISETMPQHPAILMPQVPTATEICRRDMIPRPILFLWPLMLLLGSVRRCRFLGQTIPRQTVRANVTIFTFPTSRWLTSRRSNISKIQLTHSK
jgi:hypothetical protein